MTLACTSGLLLSGPSTSTCMENGEWEPDLREAECVDASMTTQILSQALSQERKIAIASSVTVFIVTSVLFLIVGFLSGHFCRRKRKAVDHKVVKNKTPIYDDIIVLKQQEHELELKENEAYGPIR